MITGAAVISALGVNQGISRLVAPPEESAEAGGPAVADAGAAPSADGEAAAAAEDPRTARIAARIDIPRTEDQYREAILFRNIFDSSKAGGKPEKGGGDTPGADTGPADMNVKLKGTVIADPASYSAAFFLKEGETYAHAYGIGQQILNATILEILEDRVKIVRNGVEEWITIGGNKEKVDKPAPADGTAVAEGIEQVSETVFNVDKSLLDQNLNDLEGLSKLGRPLLHRGPDGEYDGYRLSAIRRGSLPDQLGIRNGDIIHMVNGTALNSVQGAMEAFQGLTGSLAPGATLKFEVTRRGTPTTLTYNVK